MTEQEMKDQIRAAIETGTWHATENNLARLKRIVHDKLAARIGPDVICFVRYAPEDKRILQVFEGNRKELIGSRWTHLYRSGPPERWVLVAILDETEEIVLRRETQQVEDWTAQEKARVIDAFLLRNHYGLVTQPAGRIDFLIGHYNLDPAFWNMEEI